MTILGTPARDVVLGVLLAFVAVMLSIEGSERVLELWRLTHNGQRATATVLYEANVWRKDHPERAVYHYTVLIGSETRILYPNDTNPHIVEATVDVLYSPDNSKVVLWDTDNSFTAVFEREVGQPTLCVCVLVVAGSAFFSYRFLRGPVRVAVHRFRGRNAPDEPT